MGVWRWEIITCPSQTCMALCAHSGFAVSAKALALVNSEGNPYPLCKSTTCVCTRKKTHATCAMRHCPDVSNKKAKKKSKEKETKTKARSSAAPPPQTRGGSGHSPLPPHRLDHEVQAGHHGAQEGLVLQAAEAQQLQEVRHLGAGAPGRCRARARPFCWRPPENAKRLGFLDIFFFRDPPKGAFSFLERCAGRYTSKKDVLKPEGCRQPFCRPEKHD